MEQTILNSTLEAFAALDFSAENAEIERIKADIAEWNAAIEKANERRREISEAMTSYRGPDGEAVANALLDGATVMEATRVGPSREDMENEREVLRAAVADLKKRIEGAKAEIHKLKSRCSARLNEAARPLADALAGEMRDAAQRLVDAFVAVTALHGVTGRQTALREVAEEAVKGVAGHMRLLRRPDTVDVPAAVQEVLAALTDKGSALPIRVPTLIHMP